MVPTTSHSMTLYCDNSGVVANSKELKSHKRVKHIEKKYHLIWDIVERGEMIDGIAPSINIWCVTNATE